MTQVEPALGQLVMIGLRVGGEPEEGEEEPLVAGFAALVQERLHVIGLLRCPAFFQSCGHVRR